MSKCRYIRGNEGRSIQIRPALACSEILVKKQAGVPFQQLRYQTPSYGDSQQVDTMWSLEALFLAGLASGLTVVEHKPFMRKNIDPIVYPGQYVSHMHSFYGSDALTKDLPTTAELQKGCPPERTQTIFLSTVCHLLPPSNKDQKKTPQRRAPTLYYVNGNTHTEIYPATFKTYYENIDRAEIPFPRDLVMVAGNASAKSQTDVQENLNMITWWCDGNGPEDRNRRDRAALPLSTCSAHLQAILRFPDCVNPDKISEYTYAAAQGNKCPVGMKRMPSLRFSIRYNTRGAIPQGWKGVPPIKLACGEVCYLFCCV
ncbi:uncharacterized protein PODANS_1_5630 [Podospora anserina S mat+]|uniref:Podospora anserina S mat+ genomic DNA chromosome 1, supercontig 1 n=1 Tax=Podospora anserina (strain S / ATCC MYA-4624 / DSM 980 / FGSC 10383) TaxID=515849 RepID=B2AAZ1_PODAN|nr:uncharacterized protein PODANS_1_5630 [Podospora anserina S mat+]CAP60253.1 unnamed protein product [Podospora anserina S mat+]